MTDGARIHTRGGCLYVGVELDGLYKYPTLHNIECVTCIEPQPGPTKSLVGLIIIFYISIKLIIIISTATPY